MNSYEYKSIAKRTVIFTTFLLMHTQIKPGMHLVNNICTYMQLCVCVCVL